MDHSAHITHCSAAGLVVAAFSVGLPSPRNTFRSLISAISILIHHTAICVHFNSDSGHAAPPSIQKGLTSENPPLALYPWWKTQKTKFYPAPLSTQNQTGMLLACNTRWGEEGTLSLTLDKDSYGDSMCVNTSLSRLNRIGGGGFKDTLKGGCGSTNTFPLSRHPANPWQHRFRAEHLLQQ